MPEQALEEWEPGAFERCLPAMEEAIVAAAQDAMADTRTAGRVALAAYAHARPDRAGALLGQLEPNLAQRLRDALGAPAAAPAGAPMALAAQASCVGGRRRLPC